MKVLIIAYDFPPLISIGGLRPYSWYKYLPGNGIAASVVTRKWPGNISSPLDYVKATSGNTTIESDAQGNQIIRANFNPNLRDRILINYGLSKMTLLRKILSFFYSFLGHLSLKFDAKAAIYFEAEKVIERNRPDLIIATGEPFILFKYGHQLSKKYNIPWLADYRDGWTTNQGNYPQGLLTGIQNSFFRMLEKKYVSNAWLITTASPGYASALLKIFPAKKVEVIYNGYDDEYFLNLDAVKPPSNKFIITYAGTIYTHQNLEMFLEGFNKFLKSANPGKGSVEVRFWGIDGQQQAKHRLLHYSKELQPFLMLHNKIPYQQLAEALRASHLLLLLSKNGANWLNAKIFDYLGARRKILLVENDHGILENLLNNTAGGVAADSADEVCQKLMAEYENFKKGRTEDIPASETVKLYSRKHQAAIFAQVLKLNFS